VNETRPGAGRTIFAVGSSPTFADRRRLLQLETLYDLALALYSEREEQDLLEELLGRVCLVLDPAIAAAVTRDPAGGARAQALVGWPGAEPNGRDLLSQQLWRDLLGEGQALVRRGGSFAGVEYREAVVAPLAFRGVFLGFVALLDKEGRGDHESEFSIEDRRFLESVGVLAGIAIDGARQVARLEGERERLAEENKALRERLDAELDGSRIVAHAPPMRRVLELVDRIAPRGVNIVIRGESGTGKELIAKLLHHLSGRRGPLVTINCGALPESLLESELFGIEGGVATGVRARRGKFELADGGTLFLDEIGDLELSLQVKLLRALQEREVTHVGGHQPIPVDVRVITATHRDLEALIEKRGFREDLYYRMKGVDVELPPLRQRRQDIPQLVRLFAEEFCRREKIAPPRLKAEALALLLAYDYPGNVRELQNLIEGAVSLADEEIDADLISSLLGSSGGETADPLELAAVERRHIDRVMRLTSGNKSAAAKLLGVDRRTLQRKGF
jgi:transcriptional regulator with GAF, ATPase, and Fis domain